MAEPTERASDGCRNSETDHDRLRALLAPGAMSVEIAAALAGDRELGEEEAKEIRALREERGSIFYSDLLYALTHQFFSPEVAECVWREILRNKEEMTIALGRNVRITVATLDYLFNVTNEIVNPTLISELKVAEIVSLSMHDGLTGLFNHSSFFEILDLEFRAYLRYGTVLSLVMLDVDDFKAVNDRHGHQEGDRILVELANEVRSSTRGPDICFRYGGEELAVILPCTGIEEAKAIAERICQQVEARFAGEPQVTVSCGVAASGEGCESPAALVRKADFGLYEAKRGGKNRVVVLA